MADRYISGTVWAKDDKSSRATRPRLDRDQIVSAAIQLLDEDGLHGLTMRRLGTKLGAAATTVYWHVASREELLDLAFDEVMAELRPPEVEANGRNWRRELKRAYLELRDLVRRHPWFAVLHGTRPYTGPNGVRFYAGEIAALRSAGCSGAVLDNSIWALGNYAIGASASLASWDAWLSQDEADLEAARDYAWKAIQPYPQFVEHVQNYLTVADPEEMREGRFTFGLDCLLDGIAGRIKAAKRAAKA